MLNQTIKIGTERRSAPPTSWDLLRLGGDYTGEAAPIAPLFAEGLAAVFASVQAICDAVRVLPPKVYKKGKDGERVERPDHPLSQLLNGDVNPWQNWDEFMEMMQGNVLLHGNAYAEVERDEAGQPVALHPFPPNHVYVVRLLPTGGNYGAWPNYAYDAMLPQGGTRRLARESVLHLRDRSDDGIIGRSRLSRAGAAFGSAAATERYANATFRNGAAMSGILSHPDQIGEEAAQNLRASFKATYSGTDAAGEVAVLEEGLKWQQISVSPDAAQMLESRRFSIEQIARIFRVPLPLLGDFSHANERAMAEITSWFFKNGVQPWLLRWERLLEKSLLSAVGRRSFEVEFDADFMLRGAQLERFQSYRIGREVGLYSANDLRKFENLNPRTDEGGDEFLTPTNMMPEQTGQPIADRTPGAPVPKE